MVAGELPFSDNNLNVLYETILKGKYTAPSHLSDGNDQLFDVCEWSFNN